MIHPNDVVEKYAPDAVIGVVGRGKAKKIKGGGKSTSVATDKGDSIANLEFWGLRENGGFRRHARSAVGECAIVCECVLLLDNSHHP